ncbi:MAG: hypothetical protein H6810_07960 [Phycisphaeraceae bacterium]|nr:MAG: hypothetical protein H6810_07960 [Phycisphaeraceae bacterium]
MIGPRRERSTRGFVLPVVILLVVMVGAVCSIMIERHVARAKTVERQIIAYQEHEGVRSLQTMIEAWRKTPTAQPREIAAMLEPDGLAFTVEPGGGQLIGVYLFQGQGTMLRRIGGLDDKDRVYAEQALRSLYAEAKDPVELELMLRDAGPLAVDVNTAPPPVLSAIVHAVLGDGHEATLYEQSLLDAQQADTEIGLQTLTNIAADAGVDNERRSTLGRFFTVSPELWRFRIDVRTASGGRLQSQYGGLILLGSGTTGSSSSPFEEPTPFLSWERLNPDDPRAVE